jgi:RNA polymerase sigma factor (sigma-70 family)
MSQKWTKDREMNHREQTLVEDNYKLIFHFAKKFKDKGLEWEELVGISSLGMCRAALKFKPELGYKLSTYARQPISGLIRDALAVEYKHNDLRSYKGLEVTNDDGEVLEDIHPAKEDTEAIVGYSELQLMIEDSMKVLDARDYEIVSHRFGLNGYSKLSAVQIGLKYDLTDNSVFNVLKKSYRLLREDNSDKTLDLLRMYY